MKNHYSDTCTHECKAKSPNQKLEIQFLEAPMDAFQVRSAYVSSCLWYFRPKVVLFYPRAVCMKFNLNLLHVKNVSLGWVAWLARTSHEDPHREIITS